MPELARINKALLAVIVAINLYVIALPLYPSVVFWWQGHVEHSQQHLAEVVASHKSRASKPIVVPAGERLIIPSIALDQPIVEGRSIYTVNKGVWRFNTGSSPPTGGNTVLIGHRFTYAGPAVFAHLDVVKLGDSLAIWWNGRQYTYTVRQIKVVNPNDISIVQPTADDRLTIYTCTPMWSTRHRLAVIGELDKS